MTEKEQNRPKKKIAGKIITAVVMVLVVALSFVGGYFSRYLFEPSTVNTTSDLVRIIENFGYVFDDKTGEMRPLTEEDYADALVNGLLDDYSAYFTPEEYSVVVEKGKGNHSGIGVTFDTNSCTVLKITGNSPADIVGMRAGDKLIKGKSGQTEKVFNDALDVIEFIESSSGSMEFTVLRNDSLVPLNFTVSRENFTASYVTYYDSATKMCYRTEQGEMKQVAIEQEKCTLLDDKTALIRLDQFEGSAFSQLKGALDYMKERGRDKLIFDLRNNGGGYMDVLTDIASCFINNDGKGGAVVAISESKNKREEYCTDENNFYDNITKIAVLANDNTASASECLIGAMLCYGDNFTAERLVVEKNIDGVAKTYGKGIMQSTYLLMNGGAFKLTTARILWPDESTCIHGKGIIATGDNAVIKGDSAIVRAQSVLNG